MILRITYWRNQGGGTAAAHLLNRMPETTGTMLYLEPDRASLFPSTPGDSEHSAQYLDFKATLTLVSRLLGQNEQVLIHSHGRRAGWHSRLCRLRFGNRVRVVHSFHGIASAAGARKLVSALSESALSALTDAVVADGPAELELFRAFPPLFCEGVLAMPAFNPEHIVEHTFRPIRRIGFAGRMAHPKLHAELIRLIAAYNEQRPDRPLTLVVTGKGPNRPEVDRLGQELLGTNYESLGHVDAIRDFYAQIDAYAQFSLFEGLGISLVEAMACGLPSMATDVIGCREVINSESVGVLVPVDDIGKQLEALDRFVNDEARSRRLSEAGKENARRRFDARAYATAHAALYARIGYRARKDSITTTPTAPATESE